MKPSSQFLPASPTASLQTGNPCKVRGHRALFSLGGRLLTVMAAALFAGGWLPVQAAPPKAAFPAAANIRPGPVYVGPIDNATGVTLIPNDIVTLDPYYNGATGSANSTTYGAILNFSVHNSGTGTETVLTSSSVGSGVTYGANLEPQAIVTVSPAGMIYYYDQGTVSGTNYDSLVMLNPTTLTRTVVSDGSNSSLGPVVRSVGTFCWDLSTNTILYIDGGASGTAFVLYRVNPATGIRTAVSTSGVAFKEADYLTTDAFGNVFYIDSTPSGGFPVEVVEIPVTAAGAGTYGASKYVSGPTVGSGTQFIELGGVAIDPSQAQTISGGVPTAVSLVVPDAGNDQTTSAIYRVSSANGNRVVIINNATNKGPATFDLPEAPAVDTTGKIYYEELHNFANGNTNNVNTLNYLTLSGPSDTVESSVQNLGINETQVDIPVPPPQPTLAAGTTSSVLGTTATLNGNVTADGGVANSGIIARGFVYAPTATNSAPKIAGTGVTQVSNFVASSLPVAQGSNEGAFTANLTGLTAGTSYTFSAYAQNVSGFNYSAPVTFTTATVPSVTTTAAASITGSSASLGGNATGAGGGNTSITVRGIVYSVSSTNSMPVINGTGVTNLTDASGGTGTFADSATGLATGTTYSYRAYATNQVGTAYGSILTFTTAAPPTANAQSDNVPFNTAKAITLTGTDPNTPAQTLTYMDTVQPTHGTLTGTAPNLTYTPASGYHGSDSFQFTVTNTSGLTSAAATVTLTVATGTPTATAQSVNVNLNLPRTITLAGTDPDVPALTLTYTVVTSPANGSLSGTAPNLTYTPNTGYTGADSFTFTVSNGTNTSSTATVSLTVIGQPTISSFTPASGPVGTTVTVTGTNLQNATALNFFRNVAGTSFTVVSSTQVTVKVPAGASSGILTLLSGSGSNNSSTKFMVTQ